ncbi:TIGR00341 family protein [Marichromatium bheemlicum]|uniref:TIGR00341 family protein n=1 Tax=Marichromatium bheemlicum TaxID=365339 RepID=A0ABX1I8Q0_9GAMM|nr:TIGR00341 family protein [Marichromatium bheemlicum]NKN32580.1 TIGR00341 family protein [Marichromatium bheemlicum]
MRIVEVIAAARHTKTLLGMARFYGATDAWCGDRGEDGRRAIRMLVDDAHRQALIDSLQDLFRTDPDARIVIQPVDTTLTRDTPRQQDEALRRAQAIAATREELYSEIVKGARLDSNHLILTVLSTLVAAIGLLEDNVAVLIGAMVIAPLLGPNIALAFATALGDRALVWQALRTNAAGLALSLLLAVVIGLIWEVDFGLAELATRTDVGLAGVVLALASGAAAVLSLTSGLSSTLVGVMVAVALLPPTATIGLALGSTRWDAALGALLLLAVNIVCVLLAAKLVFLFKGVRPRTWTERNRARQSIRLHLALWALLLSALVAIILLRAEPVIALH